MTDPSSRLIKFRLLLLHEYDFKVMYVKGRDNVAADTLSRIEMTSEDLKEMNENIMAVLTRAQRRNLIDNVCGSPTAIDISSNDWPDHPRVVEMIRLPRVYTKLVFVNGKDCQGIKNHTTIDTECGNFAYSSEKCILYVTLFTRSQYT